ncbi:MAG: hypothetical protein WHT46_07315, partial [Candidatus Geothermincolales bacterium]
KIPSHGHPFAWKSPGLAGRSRPQNAAPAFPGPFVPEDRRSPGVPDRSNGILEIPRGLQDHPCIF